MAQYKCNSEDCKNFKIIYSDNWVNGSNGTKCCTFCNNSYVEVDSVDPSRNKAFLIKSYDTGRKSGVAH